MVVTRARAMGGDDPSDDALRRTQASDRTRAVWKELEPAHDPFPKMSYGQEKLAYVPPAPGTTPTKHRKSSGDFGGFVDKAIKLKINLSATAHE